MILTSQTISIFIMLCSGIIMGACLDGFRVFWSTRKHWRLYSSYRLFEWLMWIFFGIGTFYLLFLIKGGAWRYLDPLAQFIGIFIYSVALKKISRFIGSVLQVLIIKPIYFFVHVFVMIIHQLIRMFILLVKRILFLPLYLIRKFFKKLPKGR